MVAACDVIQAGGDVMPRAARWYSTTGMEHRPAPGTSVVWEDAVVPAVDTSRPFTIAVYAGGLVLGQGPKVLFTTASYGRAPLVAFKYCTLTVEFVAGPATGVTSFPSDGAGVSAGAGTGGSGRRWGAGGSAGAGGRVWGGATTTMSASRAEAEARKLKAEAKRAVRKARKAAAAAAASEVQYDSETEALLRLATLAKRGGKRVGSAGA